MIQSLQDQFALLQDKFAVLHKDFTTLRKTSDESKCRIMDLEEENMDLMEMIHIDTPLEIQKYPTGKRGANAWSHS